MVFVIMFAICFLPVSILYPTWVIHKDRLDKKKKAIVASNHYSNLDPIIYNFRFWTKFRFMGKKELFKTKLGAWFFTKLGSFPVDRNQITPSVYKKTLAELNDNKQVFIFPEGTRNKSGSEEMGDAKAGIITFASKGDCEIVPMLLYRKPKLFRKNYIIVGEPFKVEGENPKRLTPEEMELNIEKYKNAMDALRLDLDEFVSRKKCKNKNVNIDKKQK